MKNNVYYLCQLSDNAIDDFESNYEMFIDEEKFDYEDLQNLELVYLTEIPDVHNSSYCDNINSKEVLKYDKLLDLINDYIFGGEDDDEDDEGETNDIDDSDDEWDEDDELEDKRLDKLLGDIPEYHILRYNTKTKKYSIVTQEQIDNCIESGIPTNNAFEKKTTEINLQNFEEVFSIFIDKIESLTGEFGSMITACADEEGRVYNFVIMKDKSQAYKDYIKNARLAYKKPTKSGFIYECGFENFKNFVLFNLTFGRNIGCTFRVFLSGFEAGKIPLKKIYGFSMLPMKSGLEIEQLEAKEILSCYSFDSKTKEILPPSKDLIYCGEKQEDFICGFDLM